MSRIEVATIDDLLDRYDALLIDAYGVLVDQTSALPGAASLIERLEAQQRPYVIVTNDASKLETTSAAEYAKRGLAIPPERIVTSGGLLTGYFETHGLAGASTYVVGPPDSFEYVRRAGGVPMGPEDPDADIDVLVVGDEAGFDFLPGIERALSLVLRKLDRGSSLRLVLPNPDLIYPQSRGMFGFAAGSIALLIERAVDLRFPGRSIRFDRLGKPHGAIYDSAVDRVGTRRCVMVGDQLETDIRGARAYGIDSALATWGLTHDVPDDLPGDIRPTWRLDSLT